MEREKEISRLVSVLRQTARMAMQSEWTGGSQDAAVYCVDQYNRVLNRLKEIEPDMATVFAPLPPGSSLMVAAMACRQLAAYFDEEAGRGRHWGRAHAFRFDGSTLKEIWRESAQEMEDLGEFIRESVEEWARRRRNCAEPRREHRHEARQEPRPEPPRPPEPPPPPPPPRPPDEY